MARPDFARSSQLFCATKWAFDGEWMCYLGQSCGHSSQAATTATRWTAWWTFGYCSHEAFSAQFYMVAASRHSHRSGRETMWTVLPGAKHADYNCSPAGETSWPWQRMHADFLGPVYGHTFLIVVDAYSKWPEVFPDEEWYYVSGNYRSVPKAVST